MKTTNTVLSIQFVIAMSIILSLIFFSCEGDLVRPESVVDEIRVNETGNVESIDVSDVCGAIINKDILDQNGNVLGEAFVYNTNEFFYLTLVAGNGFEIQEAFLHLAEDFSGLPLDDEQNPCYSHFQSTLHVQHNNVSRTFKFPVNKLSPYTLISAAAEFRSIEMPESGVLFGWVDGAKYGNSSPGRMFKYKMSACYDGTKRYTTNK